MITGIICEYNPLHLGHKKQLNMLRTMDPEGSIVCLMSGNYVQRGQPAVFDKAIRAKAAILSGADLVLELPLSYALSSAEGFAAGGVGILGKFCDQLCFGAETADPVLLTQTAEALLSADFSQALRQQLEKGLSFPSARQKALEAMKLNGQLLVTPNNILAVEYCKAIMAQKSKMKPLPILRQGDYHDEAAHRENPSATAVRALLEQGECWQTYVPVQVVGCFEEAAVHRLQYAERAILGRLRTMTDREFEALPYGSEGLWRKLMHAARKEACLEDILAAVKSKRYTRTRLDRMVICAFLGLTEQDLRTSPPYVRVLALNDRGRQVLKEARRTGEFINVGQHTDHPYEQLETRAERLYGLFSHKVESADTETKYRVFCCKHL